jgi:hypothetical protein
VARHRAAGAAMPERVDVGKIIQSGSRRVDLGELAKMGHKKVRAIDERRIMELITQAVEQAIEGEDLDARERRVAAGLISPHEVDALPIIRLLIGQVLGGLARENEPCFYSVPGDPIDSSMNVVYHRDIFDGLLKKLGFVPQAMAEAHALVFAELADDDFTGIAISCGAGRFNICVAYKTMPAVVFSTSRGGDWIDNNAAMVLGMKAPRAAAIKEKGVDLMHPQGREQEAIVICYLNLVNYTLVNVKNRFESADSMPPSRARWTSSAPAGRAWPRGSSTSSPRSSGRSTSRWRPRTSAGLWSPSTPWRRGASWRR